MNLSAVNWHKSWENQSHRIQETNFWNPYWSFSLNSQFRLNLMQKNPKKSKKPKNKTKNNQNPLNTQLQQSTKQTNIPSKEKYSDNYFFLRNSVFHKKPDIPLREGYCIVRHILVFTRKKRHTFLFVLCSLNLRGMLKQLARSSISLQQWPPVKDNHKRNHWQNSHYSGL